MAADDDSPPQFPLYVRVLAVAHVISLMIGPAGFVLFASIGGILWANHRVVDKSVLECLAAAITCPVTCAVFRLWFVNWGRRNWPDGKPTDPYQRH